MGVAMAVMNAVDSADAKHLENMEGNLSNGCDIFLKDEEAKELFIQYLEKDEWKTQLGDATGLDRIVASTIESISDISTEIYSEFIFSKNPSNFANEILGSYSKSEIIVEQNVEDLRRKFKTILFAVVFPIFLTSEEYKGYLEMKSYDAPVADAEVADNLEVEESYDTTTREDRLDGLFSKPSGANTNNIVQSAVASIDKVEMKQLLSTGNFARNIFATVEDLRLCVSIATARADRRGFPLIYVNKAFEKTTGYLRQDIVGHNCRFLQSENTEQDQLLAMTEALSAAQPVKVVLTNRRKDGTGKW
jgi:PAS domain-containing protein